MPQSVATIINILTQTLYYLKTRVFINTSIIKYHQNVIDVFGTFSKSFLKWESSAKDGTGFLSGSGQILLFKHSKEADYASAYKASDDAILHFLNDRKNFILNISHFFDVIPSAFYRYYSFGNNNLKMLIYQQPNKLYFTILRGDTGYTHEIIKTDTEIICDGMELCVCKR